MLDLFLNVKLKRQSFKGIVQNGWFILEETIKCLEELITNFISPQSMKAQIHLGEKHNKKADVSVQVNINMHFAAVRKLVSPYMAIFIFYQYTVQHYKQTIRERPSMNKIIKSCFCFKIFYSLLLLYNFHCFILHIMQYS